MQKPNNQWKLTEAQKKKVFCSFLIPRAFGHIVGTQIIFVKWAKSTKQSENVIGKQISFAIGKKWST